MKIFRCFNFWRRRWSPKSFCNENDPIYGIFSVIGACPSTKFRSWHIITHLFFFFLELGNEVGLFLNLQSILVHCSFLLCSSYQFGVSHKSPHILLHTSTRRRRWFSYGNVTGTNPVRLMITNLNPYFVVHTRSTYSLVLHIPFCTVITEIYQICHFSFLEKNFQHNMLGSCSKSTKLFLYPDVSNVHFPNSI